MGVEPPAMSVIAHDLMDLRDQIATVAADWDMPTSTERWVPELKDIRKEVRRSLMTQAGRLENLITFIVGEENLEAFLEERQKQDIANSDLEE